MIHLKSASSFSRCPGCGKNETHVDSHPSIVSWYSKATIPAFMTSMSKRPPSRWNFSEKLITEEKSARSTFHTSHDLNPVADSMSGRDGYQEKARDKNKNNEPESAALPLLSLRQARTSLAGFIRAKCFAASKPMPALAPTTMTVFPVRSAFSTGGTVVHWSTIKSKIDFFMDRVKVSCVGIPWDGGFNEEAHLTQQPFL